MKRILLCACAVWMTVGAWAEGNEPKNIGLTETERLLVDQNNNFAINLFRSVRAGVGDQQSLVLSPLSITYALGMINNGAVGETRSQINRVLGFGDSGAEAINAFCRKMLIGSGEVDQDTRVLIGNTIFMNEPHRLKDSFEEVVRYYYEAAPSTLDFRDDESLTVINQWASDHTAGMIEKVLERDDLDPEAVSCLLNAIYFKGAWTNGFAPEATAWESFDGGDAVPMMHSQGSFGYDENDYWQSLVMPYGNGAYRMTVLLPKAGKSIADVLERLDGSSWQMDAIVCGCDVDVKLPRFETHTSQNLKYVMSELGMPLAFSQQADFPNFCDENVCIDKMLQVAKVKVDEEGTEASGVSVIITVPISIAPDRPTFHANRPFLYLISEQSSGAIFFIGQYTGEGCADSIDLPLQQTSSPCGGPIYSLNGQRLAAPPARGIYITGGRKRLAGSSD